MYEYTPTANRRTGITGGDEAAPAPTSAPKSSQGLQAPKYADTVLWLVSGGTSCVARMYLWNDVSETWMLQSSTAVTGNTVLEQNTYGLPVELRLATLVGTYRVDYRWRLNRS